MSAKSQFITSKKNYQNFTQIFVKLFLVLHLFSFASFNSQTILSEEGEIYLSNGAKVFQQDTLTFKSVKDYTIVITKTSEGVMYDTEKTINFNIEKSRNSQSIDFVSSSKETLQEKKSSDKDKKYKEISCRIKKQIEALNCFLIPESQAFFNPSSRASKLAIVSVTKFKFKSSILALRGDIVRIILDQEKKSRYFTYSIKSLKVFQSSFSIRPPPVSRSHI